MNGTPRPSIEARNRALARLRSLTIGTAVAGFAGVAGFGAIAAITNSGVPSTSVADAGGTTTVVTTTVSNADGNDTEDTEETTTTTTTTQLKAAATPTPTRAPAQVTTGSS
jgi:cytoskeletal protein RodZ